MAFSLGSIFVDFKANTGEFISGMSKASAQTKALGREADNVAGKLAGIVSPLGAVGQKLAAVFESVGAGARTLGNTLGKTRGQMLGMFAIGAGGVTALAGGFFELAKHAADVGSKIYEASEKTGLGAAQLSGLMAITKETGGDFEGLSAALGKAGVNIEKGILAPGGEAGKVLAQVMGSAKNLTDLGLKPMGDRVQAVLARIFAMNDVGQRNLALSTLLGKGWQGNVTQLRLLAEQGYGPAIARARQLGMFFDDGAARQAKQFQIAVAGLSAEMQGLGLSIGQSVLPVMKELMLGLPGFAKNLEALGERVLAVAMAGTGNVIGAVKMWKDANANIKQADQAVTDFSVHADNMTEGQKASAEATGKLTGELKSHRDVLVELIQRERDQLSVLDSSSKPIRAIALEYRHTMEEIQKAVAAGGSYAESLMAQSLAADIFKRKLMEIPAAIPKLPDVTGLGTAGFDRFASPDVKPTAPFSADSLPLSPALTLAQISPTLAAMDSTRGVEKAMREETELSSASFKKLAAAFPNLTESMVANTAAGRAMVEQLTKLDKLGTVADQFKELKNGLITDGQDLGGKMVQILGGSVDKLEDAFAKLAVTGKGSFKQIGQSIEESVMKAGLQKGVSSLLGHFGIQGPGNKPDGTANNPLHVTFGAGKDGFGAGLASLPFPGQGQGAGGASGGASIFGNLLSKIMPALGGFGSIFRGIFSGFMADGGDVMPGRSYMVGEAGPERFVPRVPGSIVPAMGAKAMRPLNYSQTYNIITPDVNGFKRSQGQIVAEGFRSAAAAHARNS